MAPAEARIDLVDGDAAADVRDTVMFGLMAFNRRNAEPPHRAPLVLSATDDEGEIIGGLAGETAWRWLFVDLLWVADGHRGQGIGRRLVRAAEEEARRRECVGAYLDTFDFQARPFYEKEGYTVFGVQPDYPVGHDRFYLLKRW